ncbi:addiction module antitoxin [Methylomonas lenta]|jgi:antitoxin ParD1/3/4|uniref:Antitoxin ParD n=1 Tax=Methylomonas lenta TaxID=980561 RepID=A0A177NK01_9GAMM|nr:type II toxin-antitoxin system ParD family antitoxin [Methylomonas lenta]OAI17894.1 addiction module antitoxin [Methylomonas lenta]
MPTSVALSPHFETFIRDQIVSGRYNNTSEVVRAALRLMEEQQERQALQLEALKAEIAAGKNSGPGIPVDTVFARLEAKYQQQADSQ